MRIKKHIGIILSLLGCIMVLVALGAPWIGLDKDSGWGPARLFLLGSGVFFVVVPHSRLVISWVARTVSNFLIEQVPALSSIRESVKSRFEHFQSSPISQEQSGLNQAQRIRWINAQLAVVFLISVLVFTFLISVGRWTTWLVTTEHFHLLAEGFRQGHTYLALEPDAALRELDDPYLYENRQGIEHLWDASLYKGKYYLYWGPVPALATFIIESFVNIPIKDPQLVWLFSIGATLVILLLLRKLWLNEFNDLPAWSIIPPAFVVSLSNPLPWIMARPAVYEAAIIAGQFFLLLGIFSALSIVRRVSAKAWILVVPGCFMALALASRFTLLPVAVVVLTGFILQLEYSTKQSTGSQSKMLWRRSLLVFSPILIGLLLLGFYNYVRFDSMLESGHRYQLTLEKISGDYASSFAVENILPNALNYFLNPLRTIGTFPFVKAMWGSYSVTILRAFASGSYHAEQITGVLISTPFTLFSIVPLSVCLGSIWKRLDDMPFPRVRDLKIFQVEWGWLYFSLLFAVSVSVIPLLIFSYCTMRYLLDFLPALLILSSIGYASSLNAYRQNRLGNVVMIVIGIISSSYSVIIGILLGVTGYFASFEQFNPALFEKISRLLSW
jgi:hypothetical protein